MAKFIECDILEVDTLCDLGKALSSPIRVEMLYDLSCRSGCMGQS